MALQPLDLQTLFTQIDKVGKMQMAQKEGAAIQQSLQNVHNQKKTEEQVQSVDDTKDTGEGEKINDRNARKKSKDQNSGKYGGKNDDNDDERKVFKDPGLGRKIDMSG